MGALLIVGLVIFLAVIIVGIYVMTRRSPRRPPEDVQPTESSNQEKIETLRELHIRGDMKTQQYETMEDALDPKRSQEEEELKETE